MDQMDYALIDLKFELINLKYQGDNVAYLSQNTSTTDFGLVQVGNNIDVLNGIISIDQCVSPSCDVEFHNLNITNNLTVDDELVVLTIIPTAGPGISITDLIPNGYHASFTIHNTGVLELIAGPGISLNESTGTITISSSGTSIIKTIGVTTSYTATNNDEYIGVNSTSAVTITLPIGIDGMVYTIKDEHGSGSGKITITPATGEKIDNKNNFTFGSTYQSITIVFRAGQWHII